MTTGRPDDGIGEQLRELAPRVLGAVARRHGDFAAAEDAVQEALLEAATRWPRDGRPANPGGWLYHVAVRRLADRIRSDLARRAREEAFARQPWAEWAFVPGPEVELDVHDDDALSVLFMCCHPSLSPASAIALTLRAVGGLTTAEIARAFMVPEATMAQRISRAKRTIRDSDIPFVLPAEEDRPERLASVLHVLYLMFSEGYATSAGPDLHRATLSTEAIRLARVAMAMLPDDAEVAGLLALMLLNDARREARTGAGGELVPLDEQDRSLWNRTKIEEGTALASRAFSGASVGPYAIQAAIAALHDEAPGTDETDWPQILALYDHLLDMSGNPMVALNRAIALAMVHGPAAGLAAVDALDAEGGLAGHYRLDAVRGHLLAMAGDTPPAIDHFLAAARATASLPERDYLMLKAARLAEDPDRSSAQESGA